jgi:hypothetical protein
MEERIFHLRSRSEHDGDANDLVALSFELEIEGEWQPVSLSMNMPPFRAFVCASLMCQHAYLRMNATERGLFIAAAAGDFWMKTRDWSVYEVTAHFALSVRSGSPTPEDLAFICARMRDCPISRNLTNAVKTTTLEVVAEETVV